MESSGSSLPVIVLTILAAIMGFLKNYKPFKNWFAFKLEDSLMDRFTLADHQIVDFKLVSDGKNFTTGRGTTLYDLSKALSYLNEYLIRAQGQNGVIFQRTGELSPKLRDQLKAINYFSKIQNVNVSFQKNYEVAELIIKYVLEQLVKNNADNMIDGIRDQLKSMCSEFGYVLNEKNELLKAPENAIVTRVESNQYRVSEALSHLCRDWSESFRCERESLNVFFEERIFSLELPKDAKVLIIVPGAGVGQLPHFLATKFPNFIVDSIELSVLMYICGQFALGYGEDIELSPFALRYSGQLSCESQTRPIKVSLSKVKKASNLRVHWGDFREFNTTDHYDTIIVCTEFFLDTAENLFEYFQAIEQFKTQCTKLHWINAGPLKYGTRPLVQLNARELNMLRKIRGWEDLHESYVTDYKHPLIGYLTDYGSLFQCYYGAVKFHSIFKAR